MATRTKRTFGDLEKNELLKDLESWRNICIRVCAKAPIKGEIYQLAEKLIGDIDAAVEMLTGNRQMFYSKGHSTSK